MFGLLISGYASCATLDRERKAGTTAAILSKPVSRNTFFLAKFFGIFSVVILFSICAATATLLAERIAEFSQRLADEDFLSEAPEEVVENARRQLEEMRAEYDAIDRVLRKLG